MDKTIFQLTCLLHILDMYVMTPACLNLSQEQDKTGTNNLRGARYMPAWKNDIWFVYLYLLLWEESMISSQYNLLEQKNIPVLVYPWDLAKRLDRMPINIVNITSLLPACHPVHLEQI